MSKRQDDLDFRLRMIILWVAVGAAAMVTLLNLCTMAPARDLDGRFAGSALKPWFDKLSSGKGLCCSMADGETVSDPDWDTKDGHYRVRLEGAWIDVPDDAVITVPNLFGRTMVWPYHLEGQSSIRCFMPGSMT